MPIDFNANRTKRFEKLYEEEFPILVKDYYDEFSQKYKFKYTPLCSIETPNGTFGLFNYIEIYIKECYNIPYSINKHFEFHNTALFFTSTDDFGFAMTFKNRDELPKGFTEQLKSMNGRINEFGLFSPSFQGITGLSNLIKKKIKNDVELECELIKLRLKSQMKRFFIQGQVDWRWIVIDQIKYYGIEKFPNCLNHEFNQLEYSIGFFEKYGDIGSWNYGDDENGCKIEDPALDKKIRNLELNYYANLKLKKKSDYTYKDVLEHELFQKYIYDLANQYKNAKENNDVVINGNSKALGEIPLLKIKNTYNLIKKQSNSQEIYLNYLKYRGQYPDTSVVPFEFPVYYKLDIKEVFSDEKLIYEYLETFNEPENEIRMRFGLPKIGEGWISETNLFYEIKSRFKNDVVIHHGRPNWLGRQHLDIYFPKYNIGIEYQGDQHYYPIEYFGGEDSYIKNKVRDENKKQLCQKNSCHLIIVNPKYEIEEIFLKIEKAIKSQK
jgi:hypothetical protein